MDSEPDKRPRSRTDEVALEWFARLQGEISAAERAEFQSWLQASPSHGAAYRRVESLWRATSVPGERVAEEEAAVLAKYLASMDRARRRRKRAKRTAGAVALCLLLTGSGAWLLDPAFIQNIRADHVSSRGQRRLIELPDGSSVLLDADSAIDESFANGRRRVALLRGAGFFSVRPSSDPFVVETASGTVQVVGTRFEVRLSGAASVVTVEQGLVDVKPARGATDATLAPGQQIRFSPGSASPIQAVDVEDALAWRSGRLTFYQARFADVVAEIQRYRRGRIVILSNALAGRRVSGSLSLDEPEAALESLRSTVGFQLHSILPGLTVLR